MITAVPMVTISARDAEGNPRLGGTWCLHGWDSLNTAQGTGFTVQGVRHSNAGSWCRETARKFPETYRALLQAMNRACAWSGYAEVRGTFDGLSVSGCVSTYYREESA